MSDCCYTAFEKVRQNITKGPAPYEPEPDYTADDRGLKATALRFLHERCVGLRFDPAKDAEFAPGAAYTGKSLRGSTIPYNMERDIDRLCLERSLGDFLDSGTTEDAYTVYYCFLDMFLGGYEKHRRMIENLSEYERNGSSLLTKHRDHYVHSVYVFALGLAVYESNSTFRKALADFYPEIGEKADNSEQLYAHFFLEYWGLCALFHDIGYPFELPFEQVLSYHEFSEAERGGECPGPYPVYRSLESFTRLDGQTASHLAALYAADRHLESFTLFDELLAANIEAKLDKLSFSDGKPLSEKIRRKPSSPEEYRYHMDHAYFSALLLFRDLVSDGEASWQLSRVHLDVLSAILLHNSLFQHLILLETNEPLRMEQHPLAFLLMVCDELQCWDRTGYGRSSRNVQYPIAEKSCFCEDGITVTYLFSPELKDKMDTYDSFQRTSIELYCGEIISHRPQQFKFYYDLKTDHRAFAARLGKYLEVSPLKLAVRVGFAETDSASKHGFLSSSSFLHLYDLAVKLDTLRHSEIEDRAQYYLGQSLEYQLSGINRAKAFAGYLNELGLFYSDRLITCEEVRSLSAKDLRQIAPLEHKRWIEEHRKMHWHIAKKKLEKSERELKRCHHLLMRGTLGIKSVRSHYNRLSDEDKAKDLLAFPMLQKLLREQDGVRIYRFPGKAQQ